MKNRVIVYGDIHGCLDELKALRKKLAIQKGDKEYTVGDFLNKGPYSRKTLKYLQKNSILSTMGNNEEKIAKIYREYQQKGTTFLQTLKKPTKKTRSTSSKIEILMYITIREPLSTHIVEMVRSL